MNKLLIALAVTVCAFPAVARRADCAGQYSDMTCAAGQEPLGSDGRPPADTWATVQGTAATRADARSALIRADCSGQGVISILWDDFVLTPALR